MPPFYPAFFSFNDAQAILPLLLVFASAKLLGELAEKLRQPPVVGELLAGILIGPAVLGWIAPSDLLSFVAELGVLFLMFQVGLELRDFRLSKLGLTALLVAVGGVVLPFGAGYVLTRQFGHEAIAASFVGSALVATSVGITARVLAAQGWLDETASKIILAAAIIDDVLGLIVLSAVSAQARGGSNMAEFITTSGMAIGFTLIVATWGQQTVLRLLPRLGPWMSETGPFSIAVILLFSLSFAAQYVGVAAIIGAFLAGMALANTASPKEHFMVHGVTELLVPFFLAGIGLNLSRSLFAVPDLWLFMALLTAVACVTKLVGCGLPALRLGWKDAARVGVGMMPRGEVGMVVAQVGLSLQVINDDIFGAVVVMAIATTMISPPLLRWMFIQETPVGVALRLPRVG